eukprot:1159471-Pelagomonas_calceolata.AAC.7
MLHAHADDCSIKCFMLMLIYAGIHVFGSFILIKCSNHVIQCSNFPCPKPNAGIATLGKEGNPLSQNRGHAFSLQATLSLGLAAARGRECPRPAAGVGN